MGVVGLVGSHAEHSPKSRGFSRGALISSAFFLGVVLTFLVLGLAGSYLGRLRVRFDAPSAVLAAVLSVLAGLAAIFAPWLRKVVPRPEISRRGGLTGSVLYGVSYALATLTTSLGPLLLLLTIAVAIGKPLYGAALGIAFGIGRGAPFFALGLLAGKIGAWLARIQRARRAIELLSGVALLVIAWYFFHLARQLGR